MTDMRSASIQQSIPPQNAPQSTAGTAYPSVSQPFSPPVRRRRVGTFTLGLSLILIGVMIPLCMFVRRDFMLFFRLSPIVLIFLGVEVLYYAIRYKDGKLKYDGLSIFLVFLLTVGSLIASLCASLYTNAVATEKYILSQQEQIEETVMDTAADNGYEYGYTTVNWYDHTDVFWRVIGVDTDIPPRLNGYVQLYGAPQQPTGQTEKETVVTAMEKVVRAIADTESPLDLLTVEWKDTDGIWYASFRRAQLQNFNREQVQKTLEWIS